MKCFSFIVMCVACAATAGAVDLSDLLVPSPAPSPVNPDDVMLRRPADRSKAELEARAAAAAAAAEARAKAKAEAAAKAKAEAEAKAKAEAEAARAKAEAEAKAKAKAEAEAKAKAEAEAARAKAEAEAKAKAEAAKAKADAEAKAKVEEELQSLRDQVAREKEVRAAAEKRIAYLQNPDPDERPKPKKLEAPAEQRDVTETVPAPGKKKKAKGATARTGRDAVITSERTDYDRKEGIILFDRNVFVDDEQYQMHADRLFVFLDGTNDLKRIVAIGNVSITNEARTASCSRAVFTKAASKIVMYGDENSYARLEDPSQRGGVVEGKKITFWLDAEQVSVEGSSVNLPGGMLKGKDPKKLLEQSK